MACVSFTISPQKRTSCHGRLSTSSFPLWDGRGFDTGGDGGEERRDSISVWGCQGLPVAVMVMKAHRDRGGWWPAARPGHLSNYLSTLFDNTRDSRPPPHPPQFKASMTNTIHILLQSDRLIHPTVGWRVAVTAPSTKLVSFRMRRHSFRNHVFSITPSHVATCEPRPSRVALRRSINI